MIFRFRPKAKPTREHAKRWLSQHFDKFPHDMHNEIGPELFHGWRFVRGTDGVLYFANCLDRGITEEEVFAG